MNKPIKDKQSNNKLSSSDEVLTKELLVELLLAMKSNSDKYDGVFNKIFGFLERLSEEIEDLQRATYQKDSDINDISDLPDWAIDYIGKLHKLSADKIVNCKRCGDIKLIDRRCECGRSKLRRPADPKVWDRFI